MTKSNASTSAPKKKVSRRDNLADQIRKNNNESEWTPENCTLSPENTEDRATLAGKRELRVMHTFSVWNGNKLALLAPNMKPQARKDFFIRGAVASLNGPSTYLIQAGEWELDYPLLHKEPMKIAGILFVGVEREPSFHGGVPSLCFYTANYVYYFLQPDVFYEPHWNASFKEWKRVKPRPVAYRDLEPNKLRPIWFLDYECWCAWRRWCKKTFPKLVLEEGFQERRDNDVTITDEWRSSEADMAEGEKVAVGGQERTDGEDGEEEGEDEDEDEYRSSRGRGVKETRSQTATKGSNISKAKGKGRACPPSATPPPSTNLRRDLKGKGKSREEIPADRKQAEQADESEHGDDTSTLGTPSRKRTRAGRQSTGINSGCEASPSKKRAGDLAAGVRPVRKGTSPYSPGTAMIVELTQSPKNTGTPELTTPPAASGSSMNLAVESTGPTSQVDVALPALGNPTATPLPSLDELLQGKHIEDPQLAVASRNRILFGTRTSTAQPLVPGTAICPSPTSLTLELGPAETSLSQFPQSALRGSYAHLGQVFRAPAEELSSQGTSTMSQATFTVSQGTTAPSQSVPSGSQYDADCDENAPGDIPYPYTQYRYQTQNDADLPATNTGLAQETELERSPANGNVSADKEDFDLYASMQPGGLLYELAHAPTVRYNPGDPPEAGLVLPNDSTVDANTSAVESSAVDVDLSACNLSTLDAVIIDPSTHDAGADNASLSGMSFFDISLIDPSLLPDQTPLDPAMLAELEFLYNPGDPPDEDEDE